MFSILGILIWKKYIQKELHQKTDNLLIILIMMELNFLFKKWILARLKKRTIFALMCFVRKTNWLFQFTFQIKNLKTQWIDETCNWRKQVTLRVNQRFWQIYVSQNKEQKWKILLQKLFSVLVAKMCWQSIKKFMSIDGGQSVRLKKGTIGFKKYFKQIPVTFTIYADFECNLKTVESY